MIRRLPVRSIVKAILIVLSPIALLVTILSVMQLGSERNLLPLLAEQKGRVEHAQQEIDRLREYYVKADELARTLLVATNQIVDGKPFRLHDPCVRIDAGSPWPEIELKASVPVHPKLAQPYLRTREKTCITSSLRSGEKLVWGEPGCYTIGSRFKRPVHLIHFISTNLFLNLDSARASERLAALERAREAVIVGERRTGQQVGVYSGSGRGGGVGYEASARVWIVSIPDGQVIASREFFGTPPPSIRMPEGSYSVAGIRVSPSGIR